MHLLMNAVEDGAVAGPGLRAIETLITFFLIPTAMFAVIAGLSWIASAPRKEKLPSLITSIN